MASRFTAKKFPRQRFAPILQILAFAFSVIGVLYLFFPEEELLESIYESNKPSAVTISYLENLLQVYPENNRFRVLLVKQLIGIGEIKQAELVLTPLITNITNEQKQWQIVWLKYQLAKKYTFSKWNLNSIRQDALLKLKNYLIEMQDGDYSQAEYISLAQDAQQFNFPKIAAYYLNRADRDKSHINNNLLLVGAKSALAIGEYKTSANYFFAAFEQSDGDLQRKKLLRSGIDSLRSGNYLQDAVTAAERYAHKVSLDRDFLLYLARLAREAGRNDLASSYLKQALKQQARESETKQ